MEGKSKESAPSKTEARAVLFGAAGAFGAGLLGAIWYTKRKQAKEASLAAKSIDTPSSHAQITPAYVLPKMTPAEYAIAKRDATFFAFKTLGYGTLLALSGAGLLATAVGWWLDVRNVMFVPSFCLQSGSD